MAAARACAALACAVLACAVPMAAGCESEGGGGLPPDCDHVVGPTDLAGDQADLRQVLIADAQPGAKVCLRAGTWRFRSELQVAKDGLHLVGAGQDATVLEFAAQDTGGNGVLVTGDDVTLEALRVQNTPGDGIRASDARNIAFLDVTVWWDADESLDNGAYGLYPVGCTGVLIEGCLVKGARDAGIYVGQSQQVLVHDSEAWGNVAGIEIENTTDAEVRDNHAHDNTAGILVFNLPGLPVKDGKRAKIHRNLIEDNNGANFAEEGTIVGLVPPGIGVVVLASDDNEIADNTLTGHDSTGVLILTYNQTLFGKHEDAAFDAFATGNWIHGNTFADNGAQPRGAMPVLVPGLSSPAPDVMYDGCHDDLPDGPAEGPPNCLSDNGAATWVDFDFCGPPVELDYDVAGVTCTYTPLAAQTGVVAP